MLAPEELFVHIGNGIGYPNNVDGLNPSLVGRYAKRESEYLRSTHNNEAHFQGYALFNQFDWHQRARQLASEKHLYAALIANAISDHYLQDSFAPGHIITPRYNFEDEFALGMHDLYNNTGSTFEIAHWSELAPILEFIRNAPESSEHPAAYGFSQKDAIRKLQNNHESMHLQGDGHLDSRKDEELLITLIEVKSITEVLQCFRSTDVCASPAANRFSSYSWHPTTAVTPDRTPAPANAEIYFGRQTFDSFRSYSSVIGMSIGEDSVVGGAGENRATFALETVPFGLPGSPDLVRYPHQPGNANSDRPYSSNWANLNVGPAIGGLYSIGTRYQVWGPTSRLIVAFPLEDVELSAYYRYLRYEHGVNRHWQQAFGLRFDLGFSVLKGYFAVGRDHAFNQQNSLRPALLLSFGLELGGAISRIPLIDRLSQ